MRYCLTGVMALLGTVGVSRADAPDSAGGPDPSLQAVHDLAALTPSQALLLNGKRVLFRVEVVEPAIGNHGTDPSSGWCRCAGDGTAAVKALVFLQDDKERATGKMTVEATLRVDHYPATAYSDGTPIHERFYFVLLEAVKRP